MNYTPDDDFVCGFSFDHDLPSLDADEYVDGIAFAVCMTCGAEVEMQEDA